MSIKDDVAKAKTLAKDGKYTAAIAVLKKHKGNPKVAVLIKQLESRLPTEKQGVKAKNTAIGCVTIIVICAVLTLILTNSDFRSDDNKKQDSVIAACSYLEIYEGASDCNYREILVLKPLAVDTCYQQLGVTNTNNQDTWLAWAVCLQQEGGFSYK